MPNEAQRWRIKEYLRTQLEAIDPVGDYWNTSRGVQIGHVNIEEVQGELQSPFYTIEDEDVSTAGEQRTFSLDAAELVISIRGYKKTDYAGSEFRWEAEREAERLLKDAWRAVMENPGMNCEATNVQVTTPTRVYTIPALPGWVGCILTLIVAYRNPYNDP